MTWEAVCRHQDHAALAADTTYRTLYEENVGLYASLARNNTKKLGKSTQALAKHDGTRLRKAGVAAIKCTFQPIDPVGWWTAQTDATVPAVVSNLRNDEPGFLSHIQTLVDKSEDDEKSKHMSRRMSMAAARTFSGMQEAVEADPRAAGGTAQDADNLEEEEVGVLAISCLRAIFQTQNRAQTRSAAVAFLQYVSSEQDRISPRPSTENLVATPFTNWATTLFEMIVSWTPVQERFILLITAVETLRKAPLQNTDLRANLLYADLVDHILRSPLNLIGLSVMDVLLGLLDQLQRVAIISDVTNGTKPLAANLLKQRLQSCVADLANHVYYSDQITDMISTIIVRIRPDSIPSGRASPPEGDAPTNATDGPKSSTQDFGGVSRPTTRERPGSISSGQFNTEESRLLALHLIKDILDVAKTTHKYTAGTMVTTRSTVPVGVWEGTQWLLHGSSDHTPGNSDAIPLDPIARAYRDALVAWAEYESEERDAAILDWDAPDPIARLVEKARPQAPAVASLRGSIGGGAGAHHSMTGGSQHRHLLLAPLTTAGTNPTTTTTTGGPAVPGGGERRMSNGKVSSSGSGELAGDRAKPRVRYQDLKDICEGRKHVEIRVPAPAQGGDSVGAVLKLLDSIVIEEREGGAGGLGGLGLKKGLGEAPY